MRANKFPRHVYVHVEGASAPEEYLVVDEHMTDGLEEGVERLEAIYVLERVVAVNWQKSIAVAPPRPARKAARRHKR